MPVAPIVSTDPALEAHVFWYRFRREILTVLVLALSALIGFAGYRLYADRRDTNASLLLGGAKTAQDYQEVISRYSSTPAGATAYLLLAEAQRNDRKFEESNATLQKFIDKNAKHELVPTARMAMAANLESLGKSDEALAVYQRVAAEYAKSFDAPLALMSQVPILKAKNQSDAARRVCETLLTQYRDSIWAGQAMAELRSLKPAMPPASPAAQPNGPGATGPGNLPPMIMRPAAPAGSSVQPAAQPPRPKP